MHLMRYALFAASREPLIALPGPVHRALSKGLMMRVGTFHINTSAERTMIRSKENRRVELRKMDGIMDERENNGGEHATNMSPTTTSSHAHNTWNSNGRLYICRWP